MAGVKLIASLIGITPAPVKRLLRSNRHVARLMSKVAHASIREETALSVGGGLRMWFGPDTPLVYATHHDMERDVLDALLSRLAPGMTAVDVGAHMGYHALHMARAVGATGRVFAFEPDPKSCQRLRRNVTLNDADNITVQECAVSDSRGHVKFTGGGAAESHVGEGDLIVPAVTLDAAVDSAQLVKVDVEDHEVAVLRGAVRLVNEVRPAWLIEVHSPQSLAGCKALLHGYKLSTIDGLGESPFVRGHLLAIP